MKGVYGRRLGLNSELIGGDVLETMSLRDGRTVLDRIEIHITSVQIYR